MRSSEISIVLSSSQYLHNNPQHMALIRTHLYTGFGCHFSWNWELCIPKSPSLYGSQFELDKREAYLSEEAHNLGGSGCGREDRVTKVMEVSILASVSAHLSTVSTN